MAKLTRTQQKQLQGVLDNLSRAHQYLRRPDVAVALRGQHATTTLHYQRDDGSTLYEIEKQTGSNLVGLPVGIELLKNFISQGTTNAGN